MKHVSVIIPTYYRHTYLADLLTMLLRQTMMPFEVIVADQTPESDRPSNFYNTFKEKMNLRVVDIEKPSLTYPRNKAAEMANGEILLFLDDDIVISSNFVESHMKVMEEENVDVVNGAVTRRESLPDAYPWDVKQFDPVRYFLAAPNHHWQGMMLSVSSCNCSIKKEMFLAVGGFDEKLPRMVDFELGYRLFRYGAKIYFSNKPFARHLRAQGGSRKAPKQYDSLVSALYIHKKHFPGWITTQFILKSIISKKCFINPLSVLKIIRAHGVVDKLLK
ncbi:MAG: glycosyltransferase [Candidatus Omnitrophica bacterium]|nr:glycosyltransferase [Candidatus Omnitrophota bacterium]